MPVRCTASAGGSQSLGGRRSGAGGGLVRTLHRLLAALERFVFGELGQRFLEAGFGLLDLPAELADRSLQIVAPRARGARIGRIGEMMGVGDSGALFFVGDFSVEITGHPG